MLLYANWAPLEQVYDLGNAFAFFYETLSALFESCVPKLSSSCIRKILHGLTHPLKKNIKLKAKYFRSYKDKG